MINNFKFTDIKKITSSTRQPKLKIKTALTVRVGDFRLWNQTSSHCVCGSWARFVPLIVLFSVQPRRMDSTFNGISISRVGWRRNNSCSVNACQGTWVCQDWQGSVHTVVTHNNRYFISILTRPPTTFGRLVTYSYLNSTVHVMIVTELFVIHFQVPRRGFRQYFLDRRAVRQYRVLYCNYRPFTVRSITSQNPWLGYKRLLLRLPQTSQNFVAEL